MNYYLSLKSLYSLKRKGNKYIGGTKIDILIKKELVFLANKTALDFGKNLFDCLSAK